MHLDIKIGDEFTVLDNEQGVLIGSYNVVTIYSPLVYPGIGMIQISGEGVGTTGLITAERLIKGLHIGAILRGIHPIDVQSNQCIHVYKTYTGFSHTFDYCSKCDHKRS